MYVPSINKAPSREATIEFITKNNFAQVSGVYKDRVIAVHIPIVVKIEEEEVIFYAHIAKGNELKNLLSPNKELLISFMQPHCYISSSWYDHVNVPTWNYIAVHAYGKAEVLTRKDSEDHVSELTDMYEKNPKESMTEKPFHISHMSKKSYDAHINGFIAFKIKVDELQANFKLSQNRDDKNYFEIIRVLEEKGDLMSLEVAKEMAKIRERKD